MNTTLFPQLQAFLAVARSHSFTAAARDLGVSRSAVSQSVRQLEKELRVTLVTRTTRSVSLTDAGKRLVDSAGPAVAQVRAALTEVTAKPGEVVGSLRLTVPRAGFELVINPFLPRFRERHPRLELEIVFEDRRVDIVREGFDAGIRLSEFLERDMVSLRLTGPLRFIIVGAPSYLKKHSTPERPEGLLHHECLTFRSETTGSLYAWELERGRKTWRVPVHGSLVTNNGHLCLEWALQGLGLSYAFEPLAREHIRSGRLVSVLEPYGSTVPGFYLYYPSRSQRSPALRLFVEAIREFATEQLSSSSAAKRTR
jgi:DNA-binding transcriptional LysR family regulator